MEKGLVIERKGISVFALIQGHEVFRYCDHYDQKSMNLLLAKIYGTESKECFLRLEPQGTVATFGGATAIISTLSAGFFERCDQVSEKSVRGFERGTAYINKVFSDGPSSFKIQILSSTGAIEDKVITFNECISIHVIEFINKMLNYFIFKQNEEIENKLIDHYFQSQAFITKISDIGEKPKSAANEFNIQDCPFSKAKFARLRGSFLCKA